MTSEHAGTPTVVFVHGSWFGPDSWDPVAAGVRRAGMAVRVVDRTTGEPDRHVVGDKARNAAIVRETLRASHGPIVVCAHSAGCAIASEAAFGEPFVRHLVFVAGFPTDGAETPADLGGRPHAEFAAAMHQDARGRIRIDAKAAIELFFSDCVPRDARTFASRLLPQALGTSAARPASPGAWRTIPSTYVVCANDRALDPDVQRRVATRAGRVVEWPTGHVPQLSSPARLIALLTDVANV